MSSRQDANTNSLRSLMASGFRYAGELSGLTSPSSSLAVKCNEAQARRGLRPFAEIGKGQTGTVWALTGTDQVIKIANPNRSDGLWNDNLRHMRVERAFQSTSILLREEINIPRVGT